MPLNGRDAVVLCVLVFCVPLQHWLTQVSVVSPSERNLEVFKLVNEVKQFYETHFSLSSWREWFANLSKKLIDRTKGKFFLLIFFSFFFNSVEKRSLYKSVNSFSSEKR